MDGRARQAGVSFTLRDPSDEDPTNQNRHHLRPEHLLGWVSPLGLDISARIWRQAWLAGGIPGGLAVHQADKNQLVLTVGPAVAGGDSACVTMLLSQRSGAWFGSGFGFLHLDCLLCMR